MGTELQALLASHEGTAAYLEAVLEDAPGFRPPQLQLSPVRADYSGLPGEPLPVPEDLHELLGARLNALPSSAAEAMLVVAAATRPTVDLVLAATPRRDRGRPTAGCTRRLTAATGSARSTWAGQSPSLSRTPG